MPSYLPGTKAKMRTVLSAHYLGNQEKAIAVLSEKLPKEYVEEKYLSLIEELEKEGKK